MPIEEISMDQHGESGTVFDHVPLFQGNAAGFKGIARRTLGTCLLLLVVVLWTMSNFLASVSGHTNAFMSDSLRLTQIPSKRIKPPS
jgi:hypothetical protein